MAYPKSTSINLIGPRASGKTTYLATLAYFPQRKIFQTKFSDYSVSYLSDSVTEKLAHQAEDIIKKGAKLTGTRRGSLNYLPNYYFRIKMPGQTQETEVNFRDIAGEIFEDIPQEHNWEELSSYLDYLFTTLSWMVMVTDWQPGEDKRLYKPAFEKLFQQIFERERINSWIKKLRIAVVMSKCERGEIWSGRLEPEEDLFKVRLPETYDFLRKQFSPRTNRLKFFACSSFGVMNNHHDQFDPRPNRYIPDDGSSAEYNAFLREPEQWQPFGLIAPIHWLTTGKTLNDQRF
jgi:Double-GTPase 2